MSCLDPNIFGSDEDGNFSLKVNPANCGCVDFDDPDGLKFPVRCTPSPLCLIDSAGVRFFVWPELDCDCFPVSGGTPRITDGRGVTFVPTGLAGSWHTCSDGASTLQYSGDTGVDALDLAIDTLVFQGSNGVGLVVTGGGAVQAALKTSGTWGSGALTFSGAATGGAPVYVDTAGQVRTVPEHTSLNASATDGADNLSTFTTSGFATATDALSLTVNNPSALRPLRAVASISATLLVDLVSSGTVMQGLGAVTMRLEDSGAQIPVLAHSLGTGSNGSKFLTSASGPGLSSGVAAAQVISRSITAGASVTYGSSCTKLGTVIDGLTTVTVKANVKSLHVHAVTV